MHKDLGTHRARRAQARIVFLACGLLLGTAPVPVHAAVPPEDLEQAPAAETMELRTGDSRALAVQALERVAIGNPVVADVIIVSENELLVQGQKSGTTSLIVWDAAGKRELTVTVTGDDEEAVQTPEGLRRLLDAEGFSSLALRAEGGQIYVSGRLKTSQEEERLTRILDTFPTVVNLVQLALATEYVEPLIELEVRVIEVSEGATADLGVDWMDQLIVAETPFSSTDTTESLSHRVSDILRIGRLNRSAIAFAINHLVTEGYARLLAAPNLVTLSGKEASTFLGGEVPVVSEVDVDDGTITQEVEFKKIGTELKMTPTASADRSRISTVVEAELRTLDATVALTLAVGAAGSITVPGFKVRKTNTEVMSAPGETIVISGLIQDEESANYAKVPKASKIPFFGGLFRNKETEMNKTEILVIFTPSFAKMRTAPSETVDSAPAEPPVAAVAVARDHAMTHAVEEPLVSTDEAPAPEVVEATLPGVDPTTAYARQAQEYLAQSLTDMTDPGRGGLVRLRLHVLADGSLREAAIVGAGGAPELEALVLEAAKARAPYPPFPALLARQDLWIEFPVVFEERPQVGWAAPAAP